MANVDQIIETAVPFLSTYGLRVVGAILVLIAGRLIANAVRRGTRKGLERSKVDSTLIPFLSKGAYYLTLAVVLIAVLNLFGVQTASLIAVLGAASLAIGLALQGTLSSFSAGVMLLVFRPFKVGDLVEAGGSLGKVVEIGVFSTTLKTADNVMIIMPNSAVYGSTITNYNAYDTRRIDLVIGVSYGDDLKIAKEAITRIVNQDERILSDPEPVVEVADLGASSVDLVVRPWCRTEDYWAVRFDLLHRLKEGVEAAGCSIPFPQQDVHMHQAG